MLPMRSSKSIAPARCRRSVYSRYTWARTSRDSVWAVGANASWSISSFFSAEIWWASPRGRYLRGSRSRSLPMFVIRRRLSSVS